MPKGRKRRRTGTSTRARGALNVVREAREKAKAALASLRKEIEETAARLKNLEAEERAFRSELFGGTGRGPGRPPKTERRAPAARARRRGKPKADRYFAKLANSFSLDDVRKLAGRRAGISLAQWTRAKRIKKVGDEYQKVS